MLRCVALLRTDVSEEPGASFIRVTRIGELGTTQAATSNRRKLRRSTKYLRVIWDKKDWIFEGRHGFRPALSCERFEVIN
jgi:hypothetical protein